MDLHSGYPYWLVKNGLLADYPLLDTDLPDEEVLIIGSGISGALCAYVLCTAGFRCTIIDKRLLSSGSTWASTAQLNYEIDVSMYQLSKWYGEQYAVDVYKASLTSVHRIQEVAKQAGLDGCMEPKSSLYLASDKSGARAIEREYELRRKHGFPVALLTREELIRDFGIDKQYALYHQHALQLDAYRLTASLIRHCEEKAGLKVFTRTGVGRMESGKSSVVLETDRGHQIKARHVICATGYEAGQFLPKKQMTLHSTYALVTQPIEEGLLWKDKCLVWESMRPYFYLRTTADNRIMMGGEDEDFSDEKKRDKLLDRKRDALLKKCKKLFPHIPVEADFYWCGTFGETRDGLPLIGKYPGIDNIYFALGYGGNGTTYSMIAAEMICRELQGISDYRSALFSFGRKHQ
jgi:glycine/D-amino acid oxidase-like deaminating enzyme